MNPITNKRIILGVTGSIAAYKAAEIASTLTKQGAFVDVIVSDGGAKFVTPLTFHSVTGRVAYTNESLWTREDHIPHITLGHDADCIVVAPASANAMADIAHGRGDTLLPLTILASDCPLLIAPAMDGHMYGNPATQANIEILKKRGAVFIGPEYGRFASGMTGLGRFSESSKVVSAIRHQLSRKNDLSGKTVVISAGATREAIDPVRYLTNRSSGKQGYALAQSALDRGADVILITTTDALTEPYGARIVKVASAAEMLNAVMTELPNADALIMCAAVADFKARETAAQKIKKFGEDRLVLELEQTRDILADVAEKRAAFPKLKTVVGFAAETQNLLEHARMKIERKTLDFIVANDISQPDRGMGADRNEAAILFPDGTRKDIPLMDKTELADEVIAVLAEQLAR